MKKAINTLIKTLMFSDVFLNSGLGLMAPVFAIFLLQNIAYQNAFEAARIAGFASLCYWVTKSILQVPVGRYLDKQRGEKDDFWCLIIGNTVTAFIPIGYIFANQAWHIYALQLVFAVGASMIVPAWFAIFTRHIDVGKEAVEWSLYSTFSGSALGIAGGLGGIAVAFLGFTWIFIFVSAATIVGTILLFLIQGELTMGGKKTKRTLVQKIL